MSTLTAASPDPVMPAAFDFEQARLAMIEQQVRPWAVLDPRVLAALAQVRREDFVPAAQRTLAFTDTALPLAHGEHMLKPVVEGRLLQALDLAPTDDVLQIGAGTGYVTACLAGLARAVTAVELHADFVAAAAARLAASGVHNVELITADALVWTPGRQFDAVCVTGAVAQIPPQFRDWLKPGGRMVVIHGLSPAQQAVRLTRRAGDWHSESLFETDVSYLHGAAPVARFAL